MKRCKPLKSVLIVTIISCLLFCGMLISISLSPLADIGKHANQFNSFGMWLSVGLILIFYIVPLIVYSFYEFELTKYIMAILCFFGLMISIGITLLIVAVDHFGRDISSDPFLFASMLFCGLLFITNLIWFFVAFLPTLQRMART